MKEMENEFEGFESIELLCNKKRRRRKLRGDLTFLQILQFSAIYTVAATWAVRAPNIHGDAPDYKFNNHNRYTCSVRVYIDILPLFLEAPF